MTDPHVVSLTYFAVPSETTSFDNALPIEGTINSFRFFLAKGKLRIEPLSHFSSVDEARRYVDPILKSWEIDIALRFGSPELSFKYETVEIIDRDPPPPDPHHIVMIATAGEISLAGSVTLHVSRAKYPELPSTFRTNPDVDTLWNRYQGYRQGREPLPSMVYFCLTVLEAIAGGRENAANTFKISLGILSKMGQLTSQKGDLATARKYQAVKSGTPLTGPEIHWLEEAIKVIIRRVGEFHVSATLQSIELDDLPSL